MRTSARFLRLLGAAGLMISLVAALVVPVAAQEEELPDQDGLEILFDLSGAGFRTGDNTIYFPWVANGENFGLGNSRTSISVQNLEDRSTTIAIFVGNGDTGFDLETTAFLSAYASKTFSAADLNIEDGSGAPVAVVSFQNRAFDVLFPDVVPGSTLAESTVLLSKPVGVGGDFTQVLACVVNASTTSSPGLGAPVGFLVAADFSFDGEDFEEGDVFDSSFTQSDLQAILDDANAGNTGELINPFGGLNNDADCEDARVAGTAGSSGTPGAATGLDSVAIGGVAKQAVEGANLPSTSSADTAVSGYNALNGSELERFDQHYLPIVQTNCGPGGCWNSIIRVANLNSENTAVTVRFFPHDDAVGSLDTGFQVQELVDGGETIDIDLSSLVPDGWIGSAHIFTDGRIFTMVDRYKVGYNMWLTNTGSSADFEDEAQVDGASGRFALFAPHVLIDYFGWNTGINVANLASTDNNISIQYFNLLGNATQVLNQRIAPHGMTYFYDPSQAPQDNNNQNVSTDVNAGVVGSAIIWSEHPVAAAVDATKYSESDPNGGEDLFQGTSYSATQNVFTFQAVPLVQKGDPANGQGATSGINIMNPNATAATVNVFFINPSGFNAQNFGTSSVTIPGFANGFVYTMTQRNLPNGFTGAAQVISNIPVVAVSANVDYQVDGDGSAIFNAFNPCGFYRVGGECDFGDPFDPTGRSVTKTFIDEFGDPVAGVNFSIASTAGSTTVPFQRDGVSGTDGSRTFASVPAGTYELFVTSVPSGFVLPAGIQDSFAVTQGTDVTLTNTLLFNQGFEKTVIVTGSDDDDTTTGVTLEDVNVTVYENIGDDAFGLPVAGDVVFADLTDGDGATGSRLPVGDYILCISDANEAAITSNGETVIPDLTTFGGLGLADCEEFEVVAGLVTDLENEVDILEGVLNVFVFETSLSDTGGVEIQTGVAGVEVCIGVECAVTGADGFARLEEAVEGGYTVTVQGDDNTVMEATGGVLTVDVSSVTEDGLTATPATIVVAYSPTEDVAQDGFLDDVNAGAVVGSFDLNVDLGGIGSLVKFVCDEFNTDTSGCDSGLNEIQELSTITNGSFGFQDCRFQLVFDGETTSVLSCFTPSTIAAVQSALEALPNIGAGNVSVTGGPLGAAPIQIEFIGALGAQNITAQVTILNLQNAVGGANTVIQDGRASTVLAGGTVQVFVALPGSDLSDNTTWGPEVTAGPQPTDADGRFEITGLGEGTYIVCADAPTAVVEACEFADVTEGEQTLLVNNLDQAGAITAAATQAQNETQSLVNAAFSTDTFTITFGGQTTGPIGGRDSGAAVDAALEALSSVGTGNVNCTGSLNFSGTVACEFTGTLAGIDVAEMTITNSGVTNVSVTTDQDGGTFATISADATVSGGTFTVTFGGQTTVALNWNATATEVETAVNALSSVGGAGGSVIVTGGPLPGSAVTVFFGGTLAGTTQNLTIDDSNIT